MLRFTAVLALMSCTSCSVAADSVSDIADDETVVFFNTSGWLNEAEQEWQLPVHGWIYEPEDSVARAAVFEAVLESRFDLEVTEQSQDNFTRRTNLLLSDNERDKHIVVNIAGRTVELPASAENGHFEKIISIPVEDAAEHAEDGLIHFTAVTAPGESRTFSGTVRLLTPRGLSVISDIDDTVKISNVTDRRSLLEHTFLLDFIAASGMSELYRDWAAEGRGFHYVSSSPWHIYAPLNEFLEQEGFPWATFSLKAVRFRDETLLDLFKEGTETKPAAIGAILDRYPERQFVLVGDSGEQDPEVYAELLRSRPDQVQKVYIRNVTQGHAADDRFAALFEGIDPDKWALFDDPAELSLPDGF